MKVMFCTICSDIRAMDPHGAPTFCRCKQFVAWWEDPKTGDVKYRACSPMNAWFIGLHNHFLRRCYQSMGMQSEDWRDLHEETTEKHSDGYIFHKDRRNCWAAPFRPHTQLVNGVSVASDEDMEAKGNDHPALADALVFIMEESMAPGSQEATP